MGNILPREGLDETAGLKPRLEKRIMFFVLSLQAT